MELAAIASPPLTDMLGWRGAPTHPARDVLVGFDDKKDFDCELIHWDRSDPNNLQAKNFISFHDQIARWRYLIDIEGTGYSAKTFTGFAAPGFLQERPHKEDFFQHLVAWTHYVPVKRDLSDLRESLAIVRADRELETKMIENAREFSRTYLSRASALRRWSELLNGQPTPVAA